MPQFLEATFKGIYGKDLQQQQFHDKNSVKIDKNIKWRAENQQKIVDFIKQQNGQDNEDTENGALLNSVSTLTALLLLNQIMN